MDMSNGFMTRFLEYPVHVFEHVCTVEREMVVGALSRQLLAIGAEKKLGVKLSFVSNLLLPVCLYKHHRCLHK